MKQKIMKHKITRRKRKQTKIRNKTNKKGGTGLLKYLNPWKPFNKDRSVLNPNESVRVIPDMPNPAFPIKYKKPPTKGNNINLKKVFITNENTNMDNNRLSSVIKTKKKHHQNNHILKELPRS